jgi:hypothetical protein
MEIWAQITLEFQAPFDAGQNISDFKNNNNEINMVYVWMGCPSCPRRMQVRRFDKKKGCAARTPNPNREPSGDGIQPSP